MFIPLRTTHTSRRPPRVTQGLIILNMLVYLIGLVAEQTGAFSREAMIEWGALSRTQFQIWDLVAYQFLHDPRSVLHLAFNMLFLWVFGSAVEDRLHRLSFALFYLMGGMVAGLAHMMVSPAPVIGASGAVAAVTGAFLALFPRSKILVLVFFFIIGVYPVPAMLFIGVYFAIDLLNQLGEFLGRAEGGVAYAAHLAGYIYGFALSLALLGFGIVKRGEWDMLYLFRQARRRSKFRKATQQSAGTLFDQASADTMVNAPRRRAESQPQSDATREARLEISSLLRAGEREEAANRYKALLEKDSSATLPEQDQLDVGNQLHVSGEYEAAAAAYERFLASQPGAPASAEVKLLLATIYTRRLPRTDRARQLLEEARGRLMNDEQRALIDQLRTELAT